MPAPIARASASKRVLPIPALPSLRRRRLGGNRARQIVELERIQPFGPLEPFQQPLAEITQLPARRQIVLDDPRDRAGDENLASTRGRPDPRGEVDRKTDIAAVAQSRLACIEPHPHPNQSLMRPHLPREHALRLRRCRDSRSGTAKDREERVALPVDLDPSVLLEDRAKQLVVPA